MSWISGELRITSWLLGGLAVVVAVPAIGVGVIVSLAAGGVVTIFILGVAVWALSGFQETSLITMYRECGWLDNKGGR